MKHLLITGHKDAECGALLQELMAALGLEAGGGFQTEMMSEDGLGSQPVYIHAVGEPRTYGLKNLVGRCKNQRATGYPAGFETFAPRLREPVPQGKVILLDQLGLMENDAPDFQQAVLELLEGDTPVFAAVRDLDTPFLNTVRAHPNAFRLSLTEENREWVYQAALEYLREKKHGSEICEKKLFGRNAAKK